MKIEKTSPEEGYVTVTEEEYREQLSRGLTDEEVLKPGRHKFIRGGFRKRHPNFDPAKVEIRYTVTLSLPPAVYDYFNQRAQQNGAASCAEVMEKILIDLMEKESGAKAPAASTEQEALLENPQFIKAVAERVKKSLSKKSSAASSSGKTRRRAA
jgi:hypothetical protein